MTTEIVRTAHTDYMGQPITDWVEHTIVRTDAAGRDTSPMPTGREATMEKIKAWVGYDPDRAKAALVAEHARGQKGKSGARLKPRDKLITELEQRLQGGREDV